MDSKQMKLRRCLMSLNIDPTHKGYDQLYECVLLQDSRHTSMSVAYSTVAVKYNVKPESVMRNISYALKKPDRLSDGLSKLLGFPVDANSLHNGNVVEYLVMIVSTDLFDYSA